MPQKNYSELPCRIIHETPNAISVLHKSDPLIPIWFPLSQVSYIRRSPNRKLSKTNEFPDVLHVSNWMLQQKGIVE